MTAWHPLLEGDDAERAWRVIDEIAEALRPEVEKIGADTDPCFAGGTSGLASFYAYLGAETGNEEWTAIAHRLMEHSINALTERPLRPDLYAGFTGIAWAIDNLRGILFDDDDDDDDDDDPIGEALVQVLDREEPYGIGQFDLIGGLAGYGIYAFHALPRPAARRSLELLVRRLIEIGQSVDGGFSWFSPPEELPDWQLEEAPNGKFNLGVSHGVAGVLSVLGMCAGADAMNGEQRAILDRAADWFLAQKQNAETWRFSNSVIEGGPAKRDRMAWCYGDPGIAGALFTAARHTGNARWEAEALDVAQVAARRPMEDAFIKDAGLCHGSAGLAHMFNRYFQASGDPLLAEAARAWFRYTLDLQKSGTGIAGYLFWWKPDWLPTTGWLMGVSGVGAALLGAVSSREPAWDQILGVSVPLERRSSEPGATRSDDAADRREPARAPAHRSGSGD